MISVLLFARSYSNKGSAFGVIMRYNKFEWRRVVLCGNKLTTNQVEMKGIEFILKSVVEHKRNISIEIKTRNKYSLLMLSKNSDNMWSNSTPHNINLVLMVRELFSKFKDIKIIVDDNDLNFNIITDVESAIKHGTTINHNGILK